MADASPQEQDQVQPEPPGADSAAARLTPGAWVRLNRSLPYLKSADPMPMLRPPDLVAPGEAGQVLAIRAGQLVAVRFRRGSFLLEAADLEQLSGPG